MDTQCPSCASSIHLDPSPMRLPRKSQGGWRARRTDPARERRECEYIWERQKDLICDIETKCLEKELERGCGSKEERGEENQHRIPTSEYDDRDGNEAFARTHVLSKRARVRQREMCARDTRHRPAEKRGDESDPADADSRGFGGCRGLPGRT